MMAMIASPPPCTFPQEICGIICQDPVLDRRDLRALCFVSRGFRDEAERLLYVAARVRGARRIRSFCVSLAWRPHLALRVRKLMLFMPLQMDLEAEDLSRIMHALHLCLNLRDLYVLEDSDRAIHGKTGDAVQRWILDGHEFKLRRFVNAYFQPQVLVEFLRAQPTIETLGIQCRGNAGVCGVPLPMLKNLDCSAAVVQEFTTVSGIPRNFERLQFEFAQSTDVEELATFVALLQFKASLKSLSITRREGQNGLDIAVLTACVAAQLPDIKYLRIVDYTTRVSPSAIPFLSNSHHAAHLVSGRLIMFPFFPSPSTSARLKP